MSRGYGAGKPAGNFLVLVVGNIVLVKPPSLIADREGAVEEDSLPLEYPPSLFSQLRVLVDPSLSVEFELW